MFCTRKKCMLWNPTHYFMLKLISLYRSSIRHDPYLERPAGIPPCSPPGWWWNWRAPVARCLGPASPASCDPECRVQRTSGWSEPAPLSGTWWWPYDWKLHLKRNKQWHGWVISVTGIVRVDRKTRTVDRKTGTDCQLTDGRTGYLRACIRFWRQGVEAGQTAIP